MTIVDFFSAMTSSDEQTNLVIVAFAIAAELSPEDHSNNIFAEFSVIFPIQNLNKNYL